MINVIVVLYLLACIMSSPNCLYFDNFSLILLNFPEQVITDFRIHLDRLSMCPILQCMRVFPIGSTLIITTRVSHLCVCLSLAVFLNYNNDILS
jgi:CRISPR/Cas system endoribonuclease Cas6 (RAMP superfamily)